MVSVVPYYFEVLFVGHGHLVKCWYVHGCEFGVE